MPNSNRQDAALKSPSNILIVDDDHEVLRIAGDLISSLGYKTVMAGNGREAIERLQQGAFDIVLTDIMMPDMNGLQLLEHIRRYWPWPAIDVIVMTGHADQYRLDDVIRAGAIDYIAKPFSRDELEAKLERVIRERSHIRQLGKEIETRKQVEKEKERLIVDLQRALAEIKTLRGIVPICSYCKQIRDDKGYWNQVETYISQHSDAQFSHGICPQCANKHFPDFFDEQGNCRPAQNRTTLLLTIIMLQPCACTFFRFVLYLLTLRIFLINAAICHIFITATT